MKILFAADLHFGAKIEGTDRFKEFQRYSEWIVDVMKNNNPDAILLSGDIFDNSNPSTEYQRLYYTMLRNLVKADNGIQIIVIAGNHDSSSRLEAPRDIMEITGINVRGIVRMNQDEPDYDDMIIPLVSADGNDNIVMLAVPYLRDGDYPSSLGYSKGICSFINSLAARAEERYPDIPICMMGHFYIKDARRSKSNSGLDLDSIGGLDSVNINGITKKIRHIFLGHIHKSQTVGNRCSYAGSSIPMSFDEEDYDYGVDICTLTDGVVTDVKRERYNPLYELRNISGNKDEIIDQLRSLPQKSEDIPPIFIRVRLETDTYDATVNQVVASVTEDKNCIVSKINTTCSADIEEDADESQLVTSSFGDLSITDPLLFIKKCFFKRFNVNMDDEQISMVEECIKEARQREIDSE